MLRECIQNLHFPRILLEFSVKLRLVEVVVATVLTMIYLWVYTLLAVAVTGQCAVGCFGNGLYTLSSLREKALQLGSHRQSMERTQWLFPSIEFSCSAVITAIHFASLSVSEQRRANSHPQFQIWRRTPSSSPAYSKQDITGGQQVDAYFDGEANRVFTYSDLHVSIRQGDILGAYQPAHRSSKTFLTFQDDLGWPISYSRGHRMPPTMFRRADADIRNYFPLVSVEISNQSCLSGLLGVPDLLIKGQLFEMPTRIAVAQHSNQLRIYPTIASNCSGRITKISFVAFKRNTSVTQHAQLQLWRQSGSQFTKVGAVSLEHASMTEPPHLYELILNGTGFSFEIGDALGFYLPPNGSSRHTVQFYVHNGETTLSYSSNQYQQSDEIFDVNSSHVSQDRDVPLVFVDSEAVCGLLLDPPHGQVQQTGREPGDIATYSCIDGYLLVSGSETRMCSASGTWSGTKAECKEMPRMEPMQLEGNGTDTDEVQSLLTTIEAGPGGSIDTQNVVIFSVLGGVLFITLCVLVAVTVFCVRRVKNSSSGQSQHPGVSNPIYEGSYSIVRRLRSIRGSKRRQQPKERTVSSEAHYERASDYFFSMSQEYEIPLYQTPFTMSGRGGPGPMESLYWDTYYVPTEQGDVPTCVTPTFFCESTVYWRPASNSASLYEQLARNKYREIRRDQIQITSRLGSGNFGNVENGLWHSPMGVVKVAVKLLKENATESDKVKFLQEAAINGQFSHPNIVKLLGVVTVVDPVMIVLELLAHGDLRKYLLKYRPVPGEMVHPETPHLLLQFCHNVASGMEYLAKKAFVHRDLAARNILVAEDKTCKIADFGLARDLEDEQYYVSHGGQVPVKWTAPEAIYYKKYSTASDVWSFGVVMYEIWSLGHKPFERYSNAEVIRMIDEGVRLQPPPGCPRSIYSLMINCWHPVKDSRPNFSSLLQSLSEINLTSDGAAQVKSGDSELGSYSPLGTPVGTELSTSKHYD